MSAFGDLLFAGAMSLARAQATVTYPADWTVDLNGVPYSLRDEEDGSIRWNHLPAPACPVCDAGLTPHGHEFTDKASFDYLGPSRFFVICQDCGHTWPLRRGR